MEAVQTWSYGVDTRQRAFFLARKVWDISDNSQLGHEADPTEGRDRRDIGSYSWKVASLADYENGFFDRAKFEDCYVCFVDPSNYDDAPGWMLRNLLSSLSLSQTRAKLSLCYVILEVRYTFHSYTKFRS